MIKAIDAILSAFDDCFSREAAFKWFVVVIFGFIVRLDHHGVSSIIRWLGMDPLCYTSLLNFFRSTSWTLICIQERCYVAVPKA